MQATGHNVQVIDKYVVLLRYGKVTYREWKEFRHASISNLCAWYENGQNVLNDVASSYLLTGMVNSGPLLTDASGQRCITLL